LRSCPWSLDSIWSSTWTHVTEPASLWADRLPAKWRDRAPQMRRSDDGKDRWYVGDGAVMLTVGHTATAGWAPIPSGSCR